jgi:hypothetical protein
MTRTSSALTTGAKNVYVDGNAATESLRVYHLLQSNPKGNFRIDFSSDRIFALWRRAKRQKEN